jgi:hypothetical protein
MFKSNIEAKLDAEITAALNELANLDKKSEEYNAVIARIAKLDSLRPDSRLKPPSWDTVLMVGANIFGILWLARYEREHVVRANNAMRFVMKPSR